MTAGGYWRRGLGAHLALKIDVDYARYGIPDWRVIPDGDYHFTLLGGVVNVVRPFRRPEREVYVFGGVGVYRIDDNIAASAGETRTAYNLGAGLDRGKWFAEMRYLTLIGSQASTTMLPIAVGIRF